MPKRPAGFPRDDLFTRFPDLPWPRTHHNGAQAARIRQLLADSQERAARNIERQRVATARVRQRVAERQADMLDRRRASVQRRRS